MRRTWKFVLILVVVACSNFVVTADDYVSISKTHKCFFTVMDAQEFYMSDSILVQESKTALLHGGNLLAKSHTRRIVRFDEGMVYEVDLLNSTDAKMELEKFQEEYSKKLEKSLEELEKQSLIKTKLLESKRRSNAWKKVKKYGPWKERLDWVTDAKNSTTTSGFGDGWEHTAIRYGTVKKEPKDTLIVHRQLVAVADNPSLIRLGEAMTKISQFESAKEWLHWYFTKYHFHGDAGFAGSVQQLVPVGAGFDTAMSDLIPPDSGVPVVSSFRISVNDRERGGLAGKGNMINFADQSYVFKTLDVENVILSDSISVISAMEIDAIPEAVYEVPEKFDGHFFPDHEILRFWETESRIVKKEHIHIVM